MDADNDRPGPRPPAHVRRVARSLLAVIAGLALAAACAPRTASLETNHALDAPGSARVTADDLPVATMATATAHAATGATGDTRTGPRRSAGCDATAAAAIPERVVVGGAERAFLARVPTGPRDAPRDLVIAFHGRTNDAAQVRRYFGLDAALPDAIVVYPRALAAAPGTFAWTAPGDPTDSLRDFALVDALIEAFGTAQCVDLDRVFVVGHSLGAYFANDVACRLGDRVRAVASVAGGVQGTGCVGGAAALLIHHPDDRLVRVGEGERARDAFRSANVLGVVPVAILDGPLARLRCARLGDATAVDPVVWCARDDATTPDGRDPHTWPAGTATAIRAFFAGLP